MLDNANFSVYHSYVGIKIFSVASIFSLFFIFAVSVTAQTDPTKQIPRPPRVIQEQKDLILKNRQDRRDVLRNTKEDFKEKLKTIRDQRKSALVERIDERISTMNKAHTRRFSAVLEKLDIILNKISDKAQDAKPRGIDTSMVDTAIIVAKTAIDTAKEAVAMQAAKSYGIEVTSEAALKINVGSVVSVFRKDLRDVHKMVVDAKQAVQKAHRELALTRREQRGKVGEDQSIKVAP